MAEWRSSELCLRLRAIDSVPAMLDGFETVERLATSRDHMVPATIGWSP